VTSLAPLHGAVVDPAAADAVVAPPFDSLTDDGRRRLARQPDSFLGALPPPLAVGAELDEALRHATGRVEHLIAGRRFRPVDGPFLGALQLTSDGHTATAVVGDLPAAGFTDGRVLPHEHIRPARAGALARYLEVVGVASSPVAVTHRPDATVTAVTAAVTAAPPDIEVAAVDGVTLRWWTVTDTELLRGLVDAVDDIGQVYVADGHHRAAAVAAAELDADDRRVLSAVLPADHLEVAAFHRRVDGLADPRDALERVLARGGLVADPLPGPSQPDRPGVVHLVTGDRWVRVDLGARRRDGVLGHLDVDLVEHELLRPLRDVAPDATIDPVAGPLGLGALTGPDAIGVALYPPTLEDVLRVADAGAVVPPKTTYVTPKLRSGLLLVPRTLAARDRLGRLT
jgi:uncharacterized protein (DUF1015 family)